MNTRRFVQKSTRRGRQRALLIEQLETRRPLTASGLDPEELVWPGSPRAAIEVLVTDPAGYPISQVEKGDTFKLQAWIHEFAPGTEAGAYAAYTDVVFDASLASAAGAIDHGATFVEGRSGTITPGLLDEVGGFRDLENGPPLSSGLGIAGVRLFEISMTADAVGQIVFATNPAGDLPTHEIVLVGKTLTVNGTPELEFSSIPPEFVPPDGMLVSDEENPVLADEVSRSEVRLEIVEPGSLTDSPQQNPLNPVDTNADGNVSPIDLLVVLIDLKCQQDPEASGCDEDSEFYPDVNGDLTTTRHDVLHVLNYDVEPAFAGADVYVAPIGEPLTISAADGVLRNDFTSEGDVVAARLVSGPEGLTLADDGSFVWTPPQGFDDEQVEFIYTASDGTRSANAKAKILMRDIDDEKVIVSLRTVNAEGTPIEEVVPGDTFYLKAYVEDTRPRPEGVFAAYVDVEFDADLATANETIDFGSDFPNAHHGTSVSGLLDEVGGMQQFDDYQGGGAALLFSIPLIAESEGELTFASDTADTFPQHYMLLLGIDEPIPADLIRFESSSLQIIDKNRAPVANADQYFAERGVPLLVPASGVLANDSDLDREPLTVRVVEEPEHGTLELEPNGSFAYTPDADFIGIDTFTYLANDGELDSETATVTLDVRAPSDPVVAFRLQIFNDAGELVDRVTVGDEFELRVITEDVRERPQGVFAAYLDIEYSASLVSTVGEVAFGDTYTHGKEATYLPGMIDEVGAFTSSLRPVGGGEFILFSQRFTATSAGRVLFTSNPADYLPPHVVLVYGLDDEVDPGDIDYGSGEMVNVAAEDITFASFSLRVLAEGEQPLGVADAIAVNYEGAGQMLDVLANDSTAVTGITAVAGSTGSASIAPDGKSLLYSAPSDFAGHDHFTYTVTDVNGITEVVAIDVQVKSPFQNFALPPDTDADGHVAPIDALYGVNELNRGGPRRLTDADAIGAGLSYYLDVDGDHHLAPLDVLIIINELNSRAAENPEGESAALFFTEYHVLIEKRDGDVEADEPTIALPDLVSVPNASDAVRQDSLERDPSPTDLFFARLASEGEPLLDECLFEE